MSLAGSGSYLTISGKASARREPVQPPASGNSWAPGRSNMHPGYENMASAPAIAHVSSLSAGILSEPAETPARSSLDPLRRKLMACTMNRAFLALLVLSLSACAMHTAREADPNVNKNAAGLAAGGYDVVSYFDGKAQQGVRHHQAEHRGATYRFSSERNLKRFKSDPASYLPEFGGYCAFGVATKSEKFPTNPETFRVQDGRLLLFFHAPHEGQVVDTSGMWDQAPANQLKSARKNWHSMVRSTE